MRHLKTYENLKTMDNYKNMTYDDTPKVDDYIICNMKIAEHDSEDTVEFKNFINNNIGHIVFIQNHRIIASYENIPKKILTYFNYNNGHSTHVYLHEIKYFSDKIKDLEYIISSNKYNL